jgi:hypothetical protein
VRENRSPQAHKSEFGTTGQEFQGLVLTRKSTMLKKSMKNSNNTLITMKKMRLSGSHA